MSITLLCLQNISYAYDISDAISAAMMNNDTLKVSKEKLEIAKLGQAKSFTQFMPSVTYQSTYNSTDLVSPPYPGTADHIGAKSEYFVAKQNLFRGGTSIYTLKGEKEATSAAQYTYQQEAGNIMLETIKSYQQVIAARAFYTVAVQKEDRTRKIYEEVEIKLEAGVATKTSLAEAKAELAAAIASKEEAFSTVKNAEAKFVQIIGDYPPENMRDIDQDTVNIPGNFDEFLESIEDTNLDILAAQHRHEATRYGILTRMGALLPSVDFVLTSQRQNNVPNPQAFGDTYMISVSVPIFQQGTEYVDLKEAKLRERLAQYGLQETTASTITNAISAWNTYQQSKVSLVASQEALDYQKFYLDGSKLEFEIGTKSLKDLLDAELRYATRQNDVISTNLKLVISAFTIRYIMGDIDTISILFKNKNINK